ncbi:hypothetical protein E1212_03855 [Jiangella ureilytica]|uniref:Phage tail protein n=1 Tax=Jiangella ureilytica TaxID=2530374 RepID=A0A4R4RW41_9ACTN|nr:phage tail protein [Jiangella ureilytica]TDC53936.1 hypothetical protein E1212_03855 [Jiangella ureilytica]
MRKRTPVAWAAVAAAAATVLSTSTPSVAHSAQEVVSYQLTIDGVGLTMQQCIGLGTATEVVEQRVAGPDGQVTTVKVPGLHRDHDLVCTRVVTDDDTLVEWQELLLAGGPDARKDVGLTLYDTLGEPITGFAYENAWPSELTYVDAGDSSGRLLEVVTIVADELRRVS